MSSFFARLQKNKHFKNGVPFFLFIGAGAFALKEFRSVRYDKDLNPRAERFLTKEEAFGDHAEEINLKPARSLEDEVDILNETVDTENWENKRGPRPWEGTVLSRTQSPSPLRGGLGEKLTVKELQEEQ